MCKTTPVGRIVNSILVFGFTTIDNFFVVGDVIVDGESYAVTSPISKYRNYEILI